MILVIDDKIKYRHSDYATACCYAPRHMNNFVFITDARLKWKKSNIRFWYKLLLCVKNYERRIRYWCQSSIKKTTFGFCRRWWVYANTNEQAGSWYQFNKYINIGLCKAFNMHTWICRKYTVFIFISHLIYIQDHTMPNVALYCTYNV
jgi:hypothetical protein